jgi:hypothetical protein
MKAASFPLFAGLSLCAAIALPDLMSGLLPASETAAPAALSDAPKAEPLIVSAWIERPLFDSSRKPFTPGGAGPAAMQKSGSFAERFEIKGFGRANGAVLAIIVDKASAEAHRIRLGEAIDGWVFESEKDGAVTLRASDGQSATLTLARLP